MGNGDTVGKDDATDKVMLATENYPQHATQTPQGTQAELLEVTCGICLYVVKNNGLKFKNNFKTVLDFTC